MRRKGRVEGVEDRGSGIGRFGPPDGNAKSLFGIEMRGLELSIARQ